MVNRALRLTVVGAGVVFVVWSSMGQALQLQSTDISNGGTLRLAQVHSRCGGDNRSPALFWSDAPKGTESFAVTMFDSDANGGKGFWHWVIVNIPATTQNLGAGLAPAAALPNGALQIANDFGVSGFGGACPPPGSGVHHYTVTLYALPTRTALDSNSGASAAASYLKLHALAAASVEGTYGR